MELYNTTAGLLAKRLTEQYSTSFSAASRLYAPELRGHIYNIYGLVRVADEVVDTYDGQDQAELLNNLEVETYAACDRGFSVNPIVQAFAVTARQFDIGKELIHPFFESMRTDLTARTHTTESLQRYIYGSAEVVGLMCLKVFCNGDSAQYQELRPGAQRLGAAYQKINFLRDIADDYHKLGRYYFAGSTFESLDETAKQAIIADISADLQAAQPYIAALPPSARRAVALSYKYYSELLKKLDAAPVSELKNRRLRLSKKQKLILFIKMKLGGGK